MIDKLHGKLYDVTDKLHGKLYDVTDKLHGKLYDVAKCISKLYHATSYGDRLATILKNT